MGINLTENITAFPVRHGKAAFAIELRKLLWSQRFDAFAFAWPASIREGALSGIDPLPSIGSLLIRVDGIARAFLPFDPSDAYIEALRQARQRRLPVHFLEDDSLLEGPLLQPLPDAYLVHGLGLNRYYALAKEVLATKENDDRLTHRSYLAYTGLRLLEKNHSRILFLCDFPLLAHLEESFHAGSISGLLADASESHRDPKAGEDESVYRKNKSDVDVEYFPIKPSLLYFALGELPFYAGEMEKERQNPLAEPLDYLDLIKKIFVETRNQFLSDLNEAAAP